VEDRDQIQPEEDVEAHRVKLPAGPKASDDSTESGSDDFELHKRKGAVDEGGEGSDEDFELHRAKRSQK
jgi:hypothetical protein